VKCLLEYAYSFISEIFRMPFTGPQEDAFHTLLSPSVHNNIASFVTSHFQAALLDHHPEHALQSCLLVVSIGLNKAGYPAQHELLAVWVLDRDAATHHEFEIEHVVLSHHSVPCHVVLGCLSQLL
jgi:hypothetical protein